MPTMGRWDIGEKVATHKNPGTPMSSPSKYSYANMQIGSCGASGGCKVCACLDIRASIFQGRSKNQDFLREISEFLNMALYHSVQVN